MAFNDGAHGEIHELLGGSWSRNVTAYADRTSTIVQPFAHLAVVSVILLLLLLLLLPFLPDVDGRHATLCCGVLLYKGRRVFLGPPVLPDQAGFGEKCSAPPHSATARSIRILRTWQMPAPSMHQMDQTHSCDSSLNSRMPRVLTNHPRHCSFPSPFLPLSLRCFCRPRQTNRKYQPLLKMLWRSGYIGCPETCAMDVPWEDCACTCSSAAFGGQAPWEVSIS